MISLQQPMTTKMSLRFLLLIHEGSRAANATAAELGAEMLEFSGQKLLIKRSIARGLLQGTRKSTSWKGKLLMLPSSI